MMGHRRAVAPLPLHRPKDSPMNSRTALALLASGMLTLSGCTTPVEPTDTEETTSLTSSSASSSTSTSSSSTSSIPEASQVDEPATPAAPEPVPEVTPAPVAPPTPAPAPTQQPGTVIGMTGAPGHDTPRPLNRTIASCGGDIHQRGTTFFTDGTSGWTQQCSDAWTPPPPPPPAPVVEDHTGEVEPAQ